MTDIKPFDVIAGDSLGTPDRRHNIAEMLRFMADICLLADSTSSVNQLIADYLPQDLALMTDDDVLDWETELATHLGDCLLSDGLLPACTTLEWQDNELTVLPYVDDELRRFDDSSRLDEAAEDLAYVVNDHGNVTLYQRHEVTNHGRLESDWRVVWAMV